MNLLLCVTTQEMGLGWWRSTGRVLGRARGCEQGAGLPGAVSGLREQEEDGNVG